MARGVRCISVGRRIGDLGTASALSLDGVNWAGNATRHDWLVAMSVSLIAGVVALITSTR
jgi:hypothetical protein